MDAIFCLFVCPSISIDRMTDMWNRQNRQNDALNEGWNDLWNFRWME